MAKAEELTYAYFFFTDIVGLSDPRIPTKRQIKKIEALTSLILSCDAFKNTDPNLILYLPTGDGMAIGFLSGPELPLMLAVELHKKLSEYNKGKFPEEILRIRIGINDGPVYIVKSVSGSSNLWGPGILLARTVMDIGDDNHILLSPQTAETLYELSDDYKELIKPVHDYKMKHGKRLLLYSAYADGVGNSEMPSKSLYQRRKMKSKIKRMKARIVYNKIEVSLTITDPERMFTHHKKFYNIENLSDEPMQNILHGITTNVHKSFNNLNVRISDESGEDLKITSINFDKPFQKEFTTSFNTPIHKGERDRGYTLEYDAEQPHRYYEDQFHIKCKMFTISLIYPSNANFKPVVYEVNDKETKTKSKNQPLIDEVEEGLVKATWTKTDVLESQAFRLEW
ncbi:MAG: hypothetical protein ACE5J2_08090 [Nitrososphaerales archaeon]